MSGCKSKKLTEEQKIQSAFKLLHVLVSKYHYKFPHVDPSEFESAGHIGITIALRKWKRGNWPGFVKKCIQCEIRDCLRKDKRKREKLPQYIRAISPVNIYPRLSPENKIRVHDMLSLLPQEQRDVIDLKFLGYTYREIAPMLGIHKQTCFNRYHKGLDLLRAQLQKGNQN